MTVVQGAGVGGGSLVYANIQVDARPDLFGDGWPGQITYATLQPYYAAVGEMLNIRPVPEAQWPERTRLMREAATNAGYADRFQPLDLAVRFDEGWSYQQADPHNVKHSVWTENAQGAMQGTCVHLGNCDIGCDVRAKNTLDLNYIALAEKNHAEVKPLHIARSIEPITGGYRVSFDRIDGAALHAGSVTGRIVVLAAGSLGSTELLLRCRDEYRTLPNVSERLGKGWSSNGDFLTPAFHADRDVLPNRGPTITSAIDFLDGERNREHFFVEDGGFPDVFRAWLEQFSQGWSWSVRRRALAQTARYMLRGPDPFRHIMPWFAQGRDAADGRLGLRKRWWFIGRRRLHLKWDIRGSRGTIAAIVSAHEELAQATGGRPFVPPTWTLAKSLITPHPLGGCNMGSNRDHGVVDHKGEVFGYRNLYVADGAVIPKAIGANPSKTIAALAERTADLIAAEAR